jgi:hypothetical protein
MPDYPANIVITITNDFISQRVHKMTLYDCATTRKEKARKGEA